MNEKPPIQLAIEERKRTDPCGRCGKHNRTPEEIGFHIYQPNCKFCGHGMCRSFVFAPWGQTWEGLQKTVDVAKAAMGGRTFKRIEDKE